MLKEVFFLFSIILNSINCKSVCYQDYGCFTDEYPFSGSINRPVSLLPQSPEKINTSFYLWNRGTTSDGETISRFNVTSSFDSTLETKFIIHGFLDNGKLPWIIDIKDALLENDNYNVISVDWSDGAWWPYTQATTNTQLVGAEISLIIKKLQKQKGLDLKDVHLIGHSLGAHIAGYCAKHFNTTQIARVTGLDPASPYFEGCPPIVRLDSTDAIYVDILHSNAQKVVGDLGSLGMMEPIGHVDYYPNGALSQPGCQVTEGNFNLACNHLASQAYFTDSIRNRCKYTAYPCSNYDEFKLGKCLSCEGSSCNRMGFFSSPTEARGSLYLSTSNNKGKDLCVFPYQIELESGDHGDKKAKGKFSVYFQSATETSKTEVFDNGGIEWTSNMSQSFLINLQEPLTQSIVKAFIIYNRSWSLLTRYEKDWKFSRIAVYSGLRQERVELCPVKDFMGYYDLIEYAYCN